MTPDVQLDCLYVIGVDLDGLLLNGSPLTGVVKIGRSGDVMGSRLKSIQACCPLPLKVLHTEKHAGHFECLLHRRFKDRCIHFEWFLLGDDPVSEVLAALEEIKKDPPAAPTIEQRLTREDRARKAMERAVKAEQVAARRRQVAQERKVAREKRQREGLLYPGPRAVHERIGALEQQVRAGQEADRFFSKTPTDECPW